MCAQRRHRSAWASAQSDQSLCSVLNELLRTHTFFMRTVKTDQTGQMPRLICLHWAHRSCCRFCCAMAHLVLTILLFLNVLPRIDILSLRVGSCTHSSRNLSLSALSSSSRAEVILIHKKCSYYITTIIHVYMYRHNA